ncbi:hypothetical protein P4O66_003682 [Electrophorus voltai]|uniref:Reverse transcriptase domain-containing protein n=1 Tax=Electrophorus voltai TaxID=2609070 RepID=A0AAD9E571_9TELE|nr:hypothetical protein P4O66_003682 [Electrophorus voltai]
MLLVNYSSAFNTIIPSLLTTKLEDLGLHTSLCDWISNFLTDGAQSVRVGNCVSSTLTLSTGAPQGCVLNPLLYSLYTYDCATAFSLSASLPLQTPKRLQTALQGTAELLHLHYREHPNGEHHILVWEQLQRDRQALQRVVRSAECITHTELPDLQTIYYRRFQTKARGIVKDPTHPNNRLVSVEVRKVLSLPEDQYRETEMEQFLAQALRALKHGN